MQQVLTALQAINAGFGIAVNYKTIENMPTAEQAQQSSELGLATSQANLDKVRLETSALPSSMEVTKAREVAAEQATAGLGKTIADTGETKARTDLYKAQTGAVIPEMKRKTEEDLLKSSTDLRKEWQNDPTTRATKEVKIAFDRFAAIKNEETPTAAGDHALIFSYMKTIEPGMAVREGEFATVENTKGKFDAATIGLFNKTMEGRLLTEDQRNQLFAVTERLQNAQIENQNRLDDQYKRIARQRGIPENDVVLPLFGSIEQQQNQGPTPEEIAAEIRRRGYK